MKPIPIAAAEIAALKAPAAPADLLVSPGQLPGKIILQPIDPAVLDFIRTSAWRFAKTMPEHPHEYVIRHWRPDQDPLFERLVALIREQGYDARFAGKTYRYLEIDGWKYWTMGEPVSETTLINRAKLGAE